MAYPRIDIEGAIVVVTGGARGIGKSTADLFTATGATVCAGDLDGADNTVDVTSRDSFAEFTRSVLDRHGRIDVLVNNAGVRLPTVEPEAVARAIVGSVASRRAEVTVPRYLAGWDFLDAVAPDALIRLGRRVIGDRRALTSVQHDVRDAYDEAVAAQVRGRR